MPPRPPPAAGAGALTAARCCASFPLNSCARVRLPRDAADRPSAAARSSPVAAISARSLDPRCSLPSRRERRPIDLEKSSLANATRRLSLYGREAGWTEGGRRGGGSGANSVRHLRLAITRLPSRVGRGDIAWCRAQAGDAAGIGAGGRGGRGSGGGGGGGTGSAGQRSLGELANTVDACFFELCVRNSGRAAGSALHDLVGAAVDAFLGGHSLPRLLLQMQYGGVEAEEFKLSAAGYRMTSSELSYRNQWLKTIYLTMFRLQLQQPGSSFIRRRDSSSSSSSRDSRNTSEGSSNSSSGEGVRAPSFGTFEGAMPASMSSPLPSSSEPPLSTSTSGQSDHTESDRRDDSSSSSSERGSSGSNSGESNSSQNSSSSSSSSGGGALEGLAEALYEEPWLGAIVERVLEGQRTGEEQSFVHFDRALATGGASGGVAAECREIAPQWLPISQLVLLTCKVVNERGGVVRE